MICDDIPVQRGRRPHAGEVALNTASKIIPGAASLGGGGSVPSYSLNIKLKPLGADTAEGSDR
jgi:hypothetical protein